MPRGGALGARQGSRVQSVNSRVRECGLSRNSERSEKTLVRGSGVRQSWSLSELRIFHVHRQRVVP